MKIRHIIIFFFLQVISTEVRSQLPLTTDTTVKVSLVMQVKPNVVRIVKNEIDHSFYYGTFTGNIYKIIKSGNNYYDTLIATSALHNVTSLQGMIFRDSVLYLVGNRKPANSAGYGLVVRGKYKPTGAWDWDTLLRTVAYQSTSKLYDHAFSSICFSDAGDSLFIGSGSRTDHGEVQTSGGLFPNTRDVPLTSLIIRIPVNPPQPIILPNDSAMLAASPYVYCRGIRNTFDMALAPNGDLLGVENSGDRDDPEELNWLVKDAHYGFPWRMGGNVTPMQFPNYVPANDKLINHRTLSWTNNYFYNDVTYPQAPAVITFNEPIRNYGPDADKFRDTLTGLAHDASDEGTFITSFTPHRSPLGLVFDSKGKFAPPYNSAGFMLSYTEGTLDSTGNLASGSSGPFSDLSQDLLHLALFKDSATGKYTMNCYRLAWSFKNPVDAFIDDNVIYIIENHSPNNPVAPNLYALTFPLNTKNASSYFLPKDSVICTGSAITITPNIKGRYRYLWSNGATTSQRTVSPGGNTNYSLKIDNGITVSRDTISISVTTAPNMPGTITGLTKPCPGSTDVEYSVAAVNGATYYNWYFINGNGLTIASGQGKRVIKINFDQNFVSGIMAVWAGNQCGASGGRTKSVSRNIPGTPSSISGLVNSLCGGITTNYTITALSTASTYLWTVSAGVIINSGQGSTSINVTFPAVFTTGTIGVKAGNACMVGSQRTLTVRGIPAVPASIIGPATICTGQQGVAYSTLSVSGAVTYSWAVPSGATVSSGQGGQAVLVNFGTVAGLVRVRAVNACGTSSYRALAVSINCREAASVIDATIYPNPGKKHYTILLKSDQETYRLNIYNVIGEIIEQWQDIDGSEPFDFGYDLTNGIYLAEIVQGDQKKVIKLIKND